MKTPVAIVVAILWLATLIGAYHLGTSNGREATATGESEGGVGSTYRLPTSTLNGQNPAPATLLSTTVGDDSSLDVRALVRKAGAAMAAGGMMNFSAMMKMGRVLESIPYSKIPEALEEVQNLTNIQAKQGMMMMLLGRWAERDGPAALVYAEDLEKNVGEGMLAGGGAKMAVLQSWGQNDPDAVWDWYLEKRDEKDGSSGMLGGNAMALLGIFNGLVRKDPEDAFRKLSTVDDPQGRQMAISGMIQHIWDADVQQALAGYLEELPTNERQQLLPMLAGQWMMLDPDSMLEFADAQPEEDRRALMKQAGQALLYVNPEKGAGMMLENATDEDLPGTYASIAMAWANRDLNAAEEWVRAQPQGPELDHARSGLANSAIARDPEKGMQWAKEITDEGMRKSAISNVYMQWRQRDPEAADAALPESGLSPEDVEALLNQIDSKTQGGISGAAIGGAAGIR